MNNAAPVIQQLITDHAKAKENSKAWANEAKRIESVIAEIIKPEELIAQAGKDKTGGSTTVELYGGKFNVEAEKKVKWDSAALQRVAAKMQWPMVNNIFKIKFEIPEAKYNNLVENAAAGMFDKDILSKIDEARTAEIGEAKIKSIEPATE